MKKNWEIKKLGEVCDFFAGYTPKQNELSDLGDIPYFKVSDMNRDGNELFMSETELYAVSPKKIIPKDSIVFPKNGGAVFTNKKRILSQDSVIDLNSEGLFHKDYIDVMFLYYFLQLIDLKDYSKGAALPTIDMTALKNVSINVPPLEEQKRIVKILDEKFAQLETIKTNAQTNLQNAKDLFQSQLKKAFSNTTWEKKRLDEVCAITSKLVDPALPEYLDLYHVGGANIESETGLLLDLKTSKEEGLSSGKFTFDESMVLYNKIRPYLKKVARPDFAGLCSADMYPLNPKDNITKDYLYYILISDDFTKYAISKSDRAGMPKVNRKALFAYECYLPPLPEQKRIVKELDTLSEKVKALCAIYENQIADCDELKQAYLQKAFEGEL